MMVIKVYGKDFEFVDGKLSSNPEISLYKFCQAHHELMMVYGEVNEMFVQTDDMETLSCVVRNCGRSKFVNKGENLFQIF